jgi:hypothetical protein
VAFEAIKLRDKLTKNVISLEKLKIQIEIVLGNKPIESSMLQCHKLSEKEVQSIYLDGLYHKLLGEVNKQLETIRRDRVIAAKLLS